MFHQFRRNRRSTATAATPHRRSTQAPQPPHAAPVLSPTDAYAGGYNYLPSTAPGLRAHAERCLAKIRDAELRIDELHDWIAHWNAEADDYFRAAALVELDALTPSDTRLQLGPAMAADELVNGEQPGFDAVDDRPEMVSTDPDTPHRWRVIHYADNGDSWLGQDRELTDTQVEQMAERGGERSSLTYEREAPWQDGRRHVVRLEARWLNDGGFAVYERVPGDPDVPQSPAIADTQTLPAVGGVR